jgi:hypothetical protein
LYQKLHIGWSFVARSQRLSWRRGDCAGAMAGSDLYDQRRGVRQQ